MLNCLSRSTIVRRAPALLFLIMCVFFVAACARNSPEPGDGAAGRTLHLKHIELPSLRAHAIPAGNYVFRNRDEWDAFWREHHEAPSPEVDLNAFTLVVVLLGQKPNPGYLVRINKALDYESEVVVDFTEYLPSPELLYAQVIVFPFDAALVPATRKPVRFSASRTVGPPPDNRSPAR